MLLADFSGNYNRLGGKRLRRTVRRDLAGPSHPNRPLLGRCVAETDIQPSRRAGPRGLWSAGAVAPASCHVSIRSGGQTAVGTMPQHCLRPIRDSLATAVAKPRA